MTITLRESSNDLHIRAYDDHDSTIRDVYTIPVDALGGLAKLLNGGEYLRGAPRDGGQPVDALASEIATILTHGAPGVFFRRKAKAEPYAMVNEPGILQWVTRHLNSALSGYDLMRGIADGTHTIDNAVLEWCVRGLATWGKEKRMELRVYDRADTNDPILSHQFSHFVVNGHVVSTRPLNTEGSPVGYDVREALLDVDQIRDAWWWNPATHTDPHTGTFMWQLDKIAQREIAGEHDVLFWIIQPALGPLMVRSSRDGFPTGGTRLGDMVRFWHEPSGVYQPEGRLLGAVHVCPRSGQEPLGLDDYSALQQQIVEIVKNETGLTGPDNGVQYEIHLPLGDQYLTFRPKPNHRLPWIKRDLLNWSFSDRLPAPTPYTKTQEDPADAWATQIRNACASLKGGDRISGSCDELQKVGPRLDGLTDDQKAAFETWCVHHERTHRPFLKV